jgi:HEAT repeat protein
MSRPTSALNLTHDDIRRLASCPDAASLERLVETTTVRDQFLRRAAIEAIGHHPLGHSSVGIILRALSDPSGYVVRTACEIVGRWKLLTAHNALLPLLSNASASTRRSAIRALGSVWDQSDFSALFHLYQRDPQIAVRREAAWLLHDHAGADNWRALFDALYADPLSRHRRWACELADRFATSQILPLLRPLSADRDGHVRNAASRAIETVSARSK